MTVQIAEYLGQRTDSETQKILPIAPKSGAECPFMDRACDKVSKGNHPVCSVRKSDGQMWIVCEHRLCSTRQKRKSESNRDKPIGLVPHQEEILWKIAKTIYKGDFSKSNIGVKREVTIPLPDSDNNYHADYVMRNFSSLSKVDEILLEMQGGGETSNTGSISRLVEKWSNLNPSERTNSFLASEVKANPIETNAWRRQQEQFLVKGNVVSQTGGKIVFAMGSLLYDYLEARFKNAGLRDLRNHNWTLCLLGIEEDYSSPIQPGPIPLKVSEKRLLFSNYSTFVRFLTDQGGPSPEIFEGEFLLLDGNKKSV